MILNVALPVLQDPLAANHDIRVTISLSSLFLLRYFLC